MATRYYENVDGKQVLVGTSTPVRNSNGVIIGHDYVPASTGTTAAAPTSGSSSGQSSSTSSWKPADTSGIDYDKIIIGARDPAAYERLLGIEAAWGSASPEERIRLNKAANAIRTEIGGYSGGEDGSQYLPIQQQTAGGGSFSYSSAPSYKDRYSAQIETLLAEILNRDDFSYDALNDPLYQQYKAQYQREGERAMKDTLGQLSARTGGLASSYAVSAAQQANDYYASQIADKLPELYQLAYSMYLDDIDLKMQDAGLLQNMSDTQYNRYRDTMSDWRDDRNFAYDMYRDDIADDKWGAEFGYGALRDQVSDNRYDKSEAQERINAYLAANGSVADLDRSIITASGYTEAELMALEQYYAGQRGEEQDEAAAGGGPGGKGYDNGKYEETDIAGLQAWLGMPTAEQDGRYGAKSAAAAKAKGYTSLDEAMAAYQAENTGGTPIREYGTSYSSIWSRARTMFDQGKSADEIMKFLDQFSTTQLTDVGLDYIMNSLNLNGYRTGG